MSEAQAAIRCEANAELISDVAGKFAILFGPLGEKLFQLSNPFAALHVDGSRTHWLDSNGLPLCQPDLGIQDDDSVRNMSGVGPRRRLPFGLIHRFDR
jgi:hypothetical protein